MRHICYDINRGCPVEATLEVIGGKWKGVILYHLLEGTRQFGEFRRLLPNITQRMLTLQLRELERDGLINRKVYAQVPPKVEYSLTDAGRSLSPIILLMREWGVAFLASQAQANAAAAGLLRRPATPQGAGNGADQARVAVQSVPVSVPR
ncbi:MAG: helix-turn-helix transcriptional regulator [Rhodospirillales bacterium]|nr:helix-turn-helix transcriptional regulator [Rhodospirillales bacterium]